MLVFSLNLSKVVGHIKLDMLQLANQTIEFRELRSNRRKLHIEPIWFRDVGLFVVSPLWLTHKFKKHIMYLGITYLIPSSCPLRDSKFIHIYKYEFMCVWVIEWESEYIQLIELNSNCSQISRVFSQKNLSCRISCILQRWNSVLSCASSHLPSFIEKMNIIIQFNLVKLAFFLLLFVRQLCIVFSFSN